MRNYFSWVLPVVAFGMMTFGSVRGYAEEAKPSNPVPPRKSDAPLSEEPSKFFKVMWPKFELRSDPNYRPTLKELGRMYDIWVPDFDIRIPEFDPEWPPVLPRDDGVFI